MLKNKENEQRKEEEQVDRWMDCVRDGKPLPTASTDRIIDTPDWWKPENVDPEVESAISGFMASKTALASLGEDEAVRAGDVGVFLQLALVLDVLPEHYVNMDALDSHDLQQSIWVAIKDLYAQLSRGKVQVSVAGLVFGVPVDLVTSFALRDQRTIVELPLKAVVESMGDATLMSRVPRETQHYDTGSLPMIFEDPVSDACAGNGDGKGPGQEHSMKLSAASIVSPEPDLEVVGDVTDSETLPDVAEESQNEVTIPPAEARPLPETTELIQPESGIQVDPGPAHGDSNLSGVDLNSASVEQLMSLDGISSSIASDIVNYRNETGLFRNIFDLARVPGVGRRRFKRITGMAYSRTGAHRREKLARLLALPVDEVMHLPSVARAISCKPGLQGCVVSDRDGLLLAESGVGDDAVVISAIVPRMLGQIRENMTELDHDDVDSASISMRGRLLTVIDNGDVYLSVLHESNRLTSGMLKLVRRLAEELEWLLSYRGYVSVPGEENAGANGSV